MIEEKILRRVLAVIPARSGSKRIKNKNIRLLAGKPLICHAISAALGSKYVDKVMVTTDGSEIATAAKKCGAEVPFIRPTKLASDSAKSFDVVYHAVKFYEEKREIFDIIVLIQPTTPLVASEDVDAAVEKLVETRTNSCVTVCQVGERPEWMFSIQEGLAISHDQNFDENKRTQDLEPLYRINGGVYAVKKTTIFEQKTLFDFKNMSAVIMPRERSVDIDEEMDFAIAEVLIKAHFNESKN